MTFNYTGNKESTFINATYPFYILKRRDCLNKMPEYCEEPEMRDGIPYFSEELKELFKISALDLYHFNPYKYNALICNSYAYLYTSLEFMRKISKYDEIILIDPEIGILANLIAELCKVKIHYFTPKKTVKLHKNVIHYKRLPNEADIKKIKGMPLISFAHFSSGDYKNIQKSYESRVKVRGYAKYLIKLINPAAYLVLYIGDIYEELEIIPSGKLIIPPFIYPALTQIFFISETEKFQNRHSTHKFNIYDFTINLLLFNFCIRNKKLKNGNYDTDYAKTVLSLYPDSKKLIFDSYGEFPDAAEECYDIVINGQNTQLLKLYEHENIQISPYVELYSKVYVPEYTIMKQIVRPIEIIQKDYNIIQEPNLNLVQRVIQQYKSVAFYNNVDYIRQFVFYGDHIYYPEIPEAIREYQKLAPNLLVNIMPINEAKKIYKYVIPADFNCKIILDGIIKLLKPIIAKVDKPYIWIDPVLVVIEAIHKINPKLKFYVGSNETFDKPYIVFKELNISAGDWYFNVQ